MNKKLIWGIPIGMVVFGLLVVALCYAQPSFPATVTEVGPVRLETSKAGKSSSSTTTYYTTLTVVYVNDQGEEITAQAPFSTIHPAKLPKAGDPITLCAWLTGPVPYPNKLVFGIGGGVASIGGFFLFLFALTKWSLKRDEKRAQAKARRERKTPD